MSDNTILEPEAFAALVAERLDQLEGVEVRGREGLRLRVRVGQSELAISVQNFYDAYRGQPDQLDEVLAALERSLRSYEAPRTATAFAELSERIYPMLKPISLLVTIRERNLPMIVYRHFLADLIITYVIEEPSSVAYINEQHLERWGQSEHELHERAMANLRRRTGERGSHTVAGAGQQRLVILDAQDGFDATRLLMPDLITSLAGDIPGDPVVGIPNRDFLIIFSDADRTILTAVAHQIQREAAERAHGLTDQLFTIKGGEVREYEWE
jgi:uncharacterized protein YtpQ (UPF0354 family)